MPVLSIALACVNAALPALTGTEKQIEWAARLRAERLAELDDLLQSCRSASARQIGPGWDDLSAADLTRALVWCDAVEEKAPSGTPGVCKLVRAVVAALTNETAAAYWIGRRNPTLAKSLGF